MPHSTRHVAFSPFILGWVGMGIVVAIALLMLILAVATPASGEQAVPTGPVVSAATATLAAVTAKPTSFQATPAPAVQSTLVPAGAAGAAGSVTIISREPLRAQPSTESNILAWMPDGAQASRTGNEQRIGSLIWYEVQYDGKIGWCRNISCKP